MKKPQYPDFQDLTQYDSELLRVQHTNEQHADFSNDLLTLSLLCINISVCYLRNLTEWILLWFCFC